MGKEDGSGNTEIYALGKMDATLKRAENTQIVLMFERLSAGRKMLEAMYEQSIYDAIKLSETDEKTNYYNQEINQIANEVTEILQKIENQSSNLMDAQEKIRVSQYYMREYVQNTLKESKNIKKLYGESFQNEKQSQKEQIKNGIEANINMLTVAIQENRELSSNYQLLSDYIRCFSQFTSEIALKTKQVNDITKEMHKLVKENQKLNNQLCEMTNKIGKLSEDRFYMMDNAFFLKQVEDAIICHKDWMKALKKYIDSGKMQNMILDGKLSGLGIYLHAIYPKNCTIESLWMQIDEMHNQIHMKAYDIVQCIAQGNQEQARVYYEQVKQVSTTLLNQFESINKKVKQLEKIKGNVFEK